MAARGWSVASSPIDNHVDETHNPAARRGRGNVPALYTYGGSIAHQVALAVPNIGFGSASITIALRKASSPAGGTLVDLKYGSSSSGSRPVRWLTISGTRDELAVDTPGEDAPVGVYLSPWHGLPNHRRHVTYIRWCGGGEAVRPLHTPTRRPM
jgi:hypothetical protein